MSADTMQVPDATVAVLIERLNSVIGQQNELKGMLTAQSAQLGAIPVIQAQMTEFNAKFDRAFNSIRETKLIADSADTRSKFHGVLIKAAGVLIISSLGLIGWGSRQLQHFTTEDQALDRRLLKAEYKLGIEAETADGAK